VTSDMETLTSQEAADRIGVTVQKWHRLVAKHRIDPALKAPGLRGASFWHIADVDRIAGLESVSS
jgi:hypothetical protein